MDSSEGQGHVMFSFSLQDGEEAALLAASAEEIGLPHGPDAASCERRDFQEAAFRIPEYINNALAHLLRESEPPGATLWIRLAYAIATRSCSFDRVTIFGYSRKTFTPRSPTDPIRFSP
jgi:hypothetical protein